MLDLFPLERNNKKRFLQHRIPPLCNYKLPVYLRNWKIRNAILVKGIFASNYRPLVIIANVLCIVGDYEHATECVTILHAKWQT